MSQGKKSNGSQYKSLGGGRVIDTEKKTVYSPNQIEQMYQASKKQGKQDEK